MMDRKSKSVIFEKDNRIQKTSKSKGTKNKSAGFVHKTLSILLVLLLLAGLPVLPGTGGQVFAAENTAVKLSQTGNYFAVPGDTNVALTMKVENRGNSAITFQAKTSLSKDTGAIREPNPSSATVTLEAGGTTELVFSVNIARNAGIETHKVPVLLIDKSDNSGNILRSGNLELHVIKKSTSPGADESGNYVYTPALDLVHKLSPTDSIIGGSLTDLTLNFINSGNTTMKNAVVTLGLPDGITVNNSSNTLSVGYVSIGSGKTVVFPLVADEDVETKNYPFTVKIEFKDQSNASQSIEQTLYLPVRGSGSSTSLSGLSITNISVPQQVLAGQDFTLSFKVTNTGSNGTGPVKVYAEAQDGLVNRTQNAFVEQNIAAGQSKSYSVTYFTKDSAPETNYIIKLAVDPTSGSGDGIQQYTGVYVKNVGTDSIKTPQLMVSNYSFGGTFVQAGDEFRLDLGLQNTSSAHTLRNVKVTLDSGDGTFIPVRSSNSFFVDRIEKNGTVNQSVYLSVKPDAEQRTTSINVSMSYEDTEGNAFTATDVISIPVMQDTRLLVDDIISPPELYVGMQNGVSVDFYNMGRTKLHNLRINAEGDFDTMESNSYYVGNMEPGTSDSYDFSFIPRETGTMTGKVIFTYEDASGHQQIYEKEFQFQIMDMPVWNEEPWPPEEMPTDGGGILWLPIGIGAAIAIAAAIFFIRRHRKKKINEEMEINER
ncbi:MAG: COG1361 S-layer family protein [Anaerovoracaceae bacterium]